jgi:glyoxylase-like metal-dependent hydrolase (beta-lactamase superfamily II)
LTHGTHRSSLARNGIAPIRAQRRFERSVTMPASSLREILPDVFTWPWFSERHGYDFNGYLFRHASGNVAVDPVDMPNDVLGELVEIGVATILITNRNHTRASGRLREATGAGVSIHPADAAHALTQGASIDGELHIGELVGPFTVLSVDGKSPGAVALHWPERKLLVVGDACVGNPPGECALLPETVMDDAALLRRSLTRLVRTTDFDVLLVGDGAPILRGGRAALERLVASFGD